MSLADPFNGVNRLGTAPQTRLLGVASLKTRVTRPVSHPTGAYVYLE